MRPTSFIVLILCVLAITASSYQFPKADEACNITHFQYQSHISLGKNDQANRTFAKLNEKLTSLKNVSWRVNDSVTYVIYDANPTFYYRDSKQKAEIVGNDTIIIDGGFAEVKIDFKWSKIGAGSKFGTGSVFGLSDQVVFAKDIIIEGDFFRYSLVDYFNITFDHPMNLTRIDPPTTTPEEQADILKLVNNIANVTTLRHELQDDIALYYAFYLKMNLHDENEPIDKKFFYKWSSPVASKGDLIVNFTRRPVFIDVERDGMHYGYEATIDGFNASKCGPAPPTLPLDSKAYGGSQEFISYTFYENLIRFAMQKGQMDTILNKANWESRMFQFFAGDLYELFPQVAEQFIASTEVVGNCKANASEIKIYKGGNDTFNVTTFTRCELSVAKTKIIEFSIGLELQIEGVPVSDHIDFVLKSHTEFVSYYETTAYKLQNKNLADQMIKHSLNRLYEGKLFGSGWPLHPQRDYPHFVSELGSTLVYDSTHIDWKASEQ